MATKWLHESKSGGEHGYDFGGVLTATAGLFALVYGFNRAASHGWSNSGTLIFLGFAVLLLVSFVLVERIAKYPLMPMRILTERNRGGSYLGMLIVGAGLFSMFLFLGLYLQVVLGWTPLHSGFGFLPFSIGIAATAGVVSKLLPKNGPKPHMIFGLIMAASGLLLLSTITPTSNYWTHVFPALLIMSIGMANVFIPITTTALHGVGNADAGVASALTNTSQQIGGSLGTALLNTVATTATTSYVAANQQLGKLALPNGLVHGYTQSFRVGAAFLIVGALVLFFAINVGKDAIVEHEGSVAI